MMASRLLIFTVLLSIVSISRSQSPASAPAPASDSCNGVFLSYSYTTGKKISPTESKPSLQPYRFESTLTVLNNGPVELQSWQVFVGFQHDELLVSASNAVLADGTSLPANVSKGTVFAGSPSTDLMSAIETAGDVNQMQAVIDLVGTQFGVALTSVPMPSNITLVNPGFICPSPTMQGKSVMDVCCKIDPKVTTNTTFDQFLPRRNGDLIIMYDVISTYEGSYLAQVTMSIHNPLGRLDSWKLSWEWMNGEFIKNMRGAYPDVVDSSECVFGPQGQYYKDTDFSTILNCERTPTVIDLPLDKTNDTTLGLIPFCCRNGTILPPTMDPSQSSSAFQMNVFKMPPNINRSKLSPPQNWNVNGTLNPDYQCEPPVRVNPSLYPDPSGLPVKKTAFASWQVVCNIVQPKGASPKCCVSFSSYNNESIIPCNTCACGCNSTSSRTCSTTAPALLLPYQALLLPFDNRTAYSTAWADLNHKTIPNPLPCGDNCGVSINWHLYTDYNRGWTARITIFNWDDNNFVDWFVAAEMHNAVPGFQQAYSFNATALSLNPVNNTLTPKGFNNTIFIQGLPGLNYLVAETAGQKPQQDPRVPGKQQSVISFTKQNTPGINVAGGDGFPTKVFFNGDECSLPTVIPSNAYRTGSTIILSALLAVVVFMLTKQ